LPPIISLKKSTMDFLGVEEIHQTFSGGQKYVFIATCKGVKYAVKLFRFGFGEREKRELNFYKDHIDNQGIPKIINVLSHDGDTIVIEEFIEGKSLQELATTYLKDYGKISKLLYDIADIMEPIWKKGKVHRDLKPANIIVKPDGSPVVIDFGIFKDPEQSTITDTGFQPHSWDFGAPEQLLGKKDQISYRTDFFSLGVIAYFLYYANRPFGATKEEIIITFSTDPLKYYITDDCRLKKYFGAVFKLNASERPRNVSLMKETIG
jgi:eukaryotic-like serine/threonine-protein kinase